MRIWKQAGGALQVSFMAAASRATRGELGACPKCKGELRCYFHVFQKEKGQGTLWLWCRSCSMFTHLPRVHVSAPMPPDPFEQLSLKAFAELETSASEPFLDRLDRMWDEGQLFLPGAGRTSGTRRQLGEGRPLAQKKGQSQIPEVVELVEEYEQGIWSKGDLYQRVSDLVSCYPVQSVVDAVPDGCREGFVAWMRETYDNDASADDYVLIGRDDREELRRRLPILRAWLRQHGQRAE